MLVREYLKRTAFGGGFHNQTVILAAFSRPDFASFVRVAVSQAENEKVFIRLGAPAFLFNRLSDRTAANLMVGRTMSEFPECCILSGSRSSVH
jgi:hypothetical protein